MMGALPRLKVSLSLPALAALFMVLAVACGAAATATPAPTATTAPAPTATPATGAAPGAAAEGTPTPLPYAFVARAFIQELDERFPFPPPEPPWPPRRGGVLHIVTSPKPHMDPVAVRDSEYYLIWDQLLEWEAQWYYPEVQTTPTIRKNLVDSWEMIDLSTWKYNLRQGVKFHDLPPVHGREVTAEDVKYSYDLLKTKPAWGGAQVAETQVLDRYTVVFKLTQPLADYPRINTNGTQPVILPREAVEASGGLNEHPVGTGAFLLKEFVAGEGVLMVRNPDYHLRDRDGQQLPYLDAVRYIFARDEATQVALYRTKQIDIMRVSRLDTLNQIIDTVPDTWVYRIPSFMWGDYSVRLNLQKEPFNDARVRRALSMSINRDAVLEVINRSDGTLMGPFPWALAGFIDRSEYTYENLGPYYQYNPEAAKALLAEAGYPNGFDVTIEFGEIQGYTFDDFAVLVGRYFEEIGLRVRLRQVEPATWRTISLGGEAFDDVFVTLSPIGSGPTAWDWAYMPYHSQSPPTINSPYISDPQVDALLDEWSVSPPDKQEAILKELWGHLTDQVYRIQTIVPPHYRVSQSFVHAGGNPYCWHPGFCSYEAKTTWLSEGAPARRFDRFSQ